MQGSQLTWLTWVWIVLLPPPWAYFGMASPLAKKFLQGELGRVIHCLPTFLCYTYRSFHNWLSWWWKKANGTRSRLVAMVVPYLTSFLQMTFYLLKLARNKWMWWSNVCSCFVNTQAKKWVSRKLGSFSPKMYRMSRKLCGKIIWGGTSGNRKCHLVNCKQVCEGWRWLGIKMWGLPTMPSYWSWLGDWWSRGTPFGLRCCVANITQTMTCFGIFPGKQTCLLFGKVFIRCGLTFSTKPSSGMMGGWKEWARSP